LSAVRDLGRGGIWVEPDNKRGRQTVTGNPRLSTSVLHKQWTRLENEHHELAITIGAGRARGVDLTLLRDRQAKLLLEINSRVA